MTGTRGPDATRGRRRERGSATVLVLALVPVLVLGTALGVAIAQLAAARQAAASAADLAALAGASWLADPAALIEADPSVRACARAAEVAAANAATLVSCSVDGDDVVVSAEVAPPSLVRRIAALAGGDPAAVRAGARAGPAATTTGEGEADGPAGG